MSVGMSKRATQRVAYWIEQTIAIALTVASIWFAARIGYREAVRFAAYQDLRTTRDTVVGLEQELAVNRRALARAVQDLDGEALRRLSMSTRRFEAAKQSDAFFKLDRDALNALSDAYGGSMARLLSEMRERQATGGETMRAHARTLVFMLERMEEGAPKLRAAVEALAARTREMVGESDDPLPTYTWPEDPPPALDPSLEPAMAMTPSEGWTRAEPGPYPGEVTTVYFGDTMVPSHRIGPNVITWSVRLPEGRTPARLHVVFTSRAPVRRGESLVAGVDEERLRALLGGQLPGARIMTHDVSKTRGQVVDPNFPDWRWVFVLVEDDAGDRVPARIDVWKAWDKDQGHRHRLAPEAGALVLPKAPARS